MKNILTFTFAILFSYSIMAQIETPQPSPKGSVYSKVGLTHVTIDYFRPGVKGRKIFGEGSDYLQPYGQIWRSGANNGSKLTLSTDATIAGTMVKAGEYLIFTVPGKVEWKFMLYSDISIGGNVNAYKKENEVVNASIKPIQLSKNVERLTYSIDDISADNTMAKITLSWADVALEVPIKVDFDKSVMASIADNMQVNPNNYVTAANYYLSSGKDLPQALKWMDMYLAIEGNETKFWHIHTKAQILAAMGNKKEAKATAQKSMEIAKNSPNGDFGYIKRNQDLINSL